MAQAKIDYWLIKHIDDETKRKVKSHAALKGVTVAQALTELVNAGYAALSK